MSITSNTNKNILFNSIELEELEGKTPEQYIADRFRSEMGWSIERQGPQKAALDWLQGLALNIPFYNDEIIELAKANGWYKQKPTQKGQDSEDIRVVDNYWKAMAAQVVYITRDNGGF